MATYTISDIINGVEKPKFEKERVKEGAKNADMARGGYAHIR